MVTMALSRTVCPLRGRRLDDLREGNLRGLPGSSGIAEQVYSDGVHVAALDAPQQAEVALVPPPQPSSRYLKWCRGFR